MQKLLVFATAVMLLAMFSINSYASTIQITNSTGSVYAKSIGYVGGSLSYTSEYGMPTVGDYSDHGYMGSRIIVKFDLSEWYKLSMPKESISSIGVSITGAGGGRNYAYDRSAKDLFDISQAYKGDLNVQSNLGYYNAAVGEALSSGLGSVNYTFSADFLETFLENDIVNGLTGLGGSQNTTYAGFIMILQDKPMSTKEYNYYRDHTESDPLQAPYLEIVYNENYAPSCARTDINDITWNWYCRFDS